MRISGIWIFPAAIAACGCRQGPAHAPEETDGRGSTGRAPQEDAVAPATTVVTEDAPIPPMPVWQVLGKTKADVETLFTPQGLADPAVWVVYGKDFSVRYEGDTAVELMHRIPGGKGCVEAARWLGFDGASAPFRDPESCKWPGLSMKHTLGPPGLAGELMLGTGIFRVRISDLDAYRKGMPEEDP